VADEILERIDAWRASGLIDDTTAARLKAAEEGLILIGTGIVADRLRRTLAGRRMDSGPPPADPPAAASEATPAPT
jgi:hypothetical protein